MLVTPRSTPNTPSTSIGSGVSTSHTANKYHSPPTSARSVSPRCEASNCRCRLPQTNGMACRPESVRHFRLGQGEREDAVVIGDGAMRGERPLDRPVELIGVCHLCNAPYHHLRCKLECFAHRLVYQLVYGKLPERLGFPGNTADVVACLIRPFERAPQGVRLLRRRLQLQLYRESHNMKSIPQPERPCKRALKQRRNILRLFSRALLPALRDATSCVSPGFPRLKASYL